MTIAMHQDTSAQKHLEEEVSQLRKRLVSALAEVEGCKEQRCEIEKTLDRARGELKYTKTELTVAKKELEVASLCHEKSIESFREMLVDLGAKHGVPAQEIDSLCSRVESLSFKAV